MNIARVMIPKSLTIFLHDSDTVRQGMETMNRHGYTALPVIDHNGAYIGSVNEGDLLRCVLAAGTTDSRALEGYRIGDILRRDFCPALPIDAEENKVVDAILQQNFVPVVDARNVLCGIVTRHRLISYLTDRPLTL